MFISSHLRLSIPPVLGPVLIVQNDTNVLSTITDPSIRVPNIIAFMNDGEVPVTLHFDASNNKAQVTGTIAGNYDLVTLTNDQLLISVDGETAVAIAVTDGAAITAAQVCTNINNAFAAAGGNTALAQAQVRSTFICITSGTSGPQSSIVISTPALYSANATLGFTAGNSNSSNSFVQDIVADITIQAKGMGTFTNPRPGASVLAIRGVVGNGTGGIASVIDATALFSYSGVQQ